MRNVAEKAVNQVENEWLRRAIEATGDLLYDWDLTTNRITWVGRPVEIFGTDDLGSLALGETFLARINPEDVPARLKALADHLAEGKPYDCEYRIRAENGGFCWVHDRGSGESGGKSAPRRISGSLRLITSRKQHEARLERLASFDELTGHLNQLRLRDALEHALTFSRRDNRPAGYLVIGVDKLSFINNSLGHEAGDAIMIAIGQRLDRCMRASDVIGRIGGDRFGVVLSQCSEGQQVRAAERVLQAVREHAIETPDAETHVSVSIGGVQFSELCHTAYDVMSKAETALKQAKREGRDRFVAYRASGRQGEQHRRNLLVGNQVKKALSESRLRFAFQPVVRAGSQQAVFHECLLRMCDEAGQIITAGVFIPIIEQLGLVRIVDRYVLEMAIEALCVNPALNLAINISSLTASDQPWLRMLSAMVKNKSGIGNRLIIEITETSAFNDFDESARFLSAIRELGCRVAVDDFGAGFTSFRHLKTLPLDIVKIDGSFVKNLTDNVDNQLFIRNLLGLADAHGMETVAESVETLEDAKFLVGEGVQYLQGYYFGRPSLDVPIAGGISRPMVTVQ